MHENRNPIKQYNGKENRDIYNQIVIRLSCKRWLHFMRLKKLLKILLTCWIFQQLRSAQCKIVTLGKAPLTHHDLLIVNNPAG